MSEQESAPDTEAPGPDQREIIRSLREELRETNEGLVALTLEREKHERTLTALHESSRALLHAETHDDVCDTILETTTNVVGIPGAGVYLSSGDEPGLRPAASTEYVEDRFGELPTIGPGEDSIAWRAFDEGETIVIDDVREFDLDDRLGEPLRSGIWIPLGDHGVLAAVSEDTGAFDADEQQLAGLLAASTEAALDRVEQEANRRRRESQLEALIEATGELLAAETSGDVCETVVETAETALDLPLTMIALYDDEAGTIRPRSQTNLAETVIDAERILDPQAELAWQAFVEKRVTFHDGLVVDEAADGIDAETYGVAILPLGKHGVFITGSTAIDGAGDEKLTLARILAASTEPALARLLAANTESSLDRADRERQLIERDERLYEQNERLKRLNRVNDVIRDIDQALVTADSRAAIEQAVCTQLTTAGPYTFAWIGDHDAVSDVIAPHARGGVEEGYLDAVAQATDDGSIEHGPTERARETREPQVVDDLLGDPPFPRWRQEALKRGYRACIAIPLTYREMPYGVLTVYADRPGTFGELERTVLIELGETIAYAINAVESKKALVSDEFVELEFAVRDESIPFLSVTTEVECTVTLESVIARSGGGYRIFYTTRGVPSETVLKHMGRAFTVDDTRLVTEHDEECLFECTLDESSFFGTLLDHGAVPQRFTAEAGDGRAVVALPQSADVRLFLDMIGTAYENSELLARREQSRDGDRRTRKGFTADVDEALTDRQREVLRTAYESGFFESPRENTGSEVSETLGVSQPTFNNHLRAAQRKFFGLLFETE